MLKKNLLLFSFFITLLELQAQTRLLKRKVVDSDTVIEVFMQKNDKSLGEVVVIGYGKQQKKDTTSAISSISAPLSFLLFNTNDITVYLEYRFCIPEAICTSLL